MSSVAVTDGMIIEKDLMVPTRDRSPLCLNVFRPTDGRAAPVVLCMSPYGKDTPVRGIPRAYGLESDTGPNAIWETGDPDWWVPRGYAMVRVDARGSFKSPGRPDFLSMKDREDYHDMVEWCGTQPWSNGRVGLLGISYYAMSQWPVAALQPPHLAAIIPWEGMSDIYREWARQGGMYYCFTDFWWNEHWVSQGKDMSHGVDWRKEFRAREFDDAWYEERRADLSKVTVPVLSAGNWGAFHMHLRGNVEAFTQVASTHKRLLMFVGSHIGPFYTDWGKAEQLRFFDRWLKGEQNGAEEDAPVRLAIRHGTEIKWRDEQEWPLARTEWTRIHLDAEANALSGSPVARRSAVTYRMPEGGISVGSSRVDLQACKLEYSIVSPK